MRKFTVYSAVVQGGKPYRVKVTCDPHASPFGVTVPVFVPNCQRLTIELSVELQHPRFKGEVSITGLPPGESIVEGLPLAVVAAVLGANLDPDNRSGLEGTMWYGSPYHGVPLATQGVVAAAIESEHVIYTCNPPNWLRDNVPVKAVEGLAHMRRLFEPKQATQLRFQDFNGYSEHNLDAVVAAVRGGIPIVFVGGYSSAASHLCLATAGLSLPASEDERLMMAARYNLVGRHPPLDRPVRTLYSVMSDRAVWGTKAEPGEVALADCGWVAIPDLATLRADVVWGVFEGARTMRAGEFDTNYRLVASYVPRKSDPAAALHECKNYLDSIGVHDGYYMSECPSFGTGDATTTTEDMLKRIKNT